jgi:pleiotropic regulator 1
VRLWDLVAGRASAVLTNHKKAVRALALHPTEYTFATASADNMKIWKCPEGKFLHNVSGANCIVNSLAINEDNVMVSGSDNGLLHFWDWKSGYNFHTSETVAQPGAPPTPPPRLKHGPPRLLPAALLPTLAGTVHWSRLA